MKYNIELKNVVLDNPKGINYAVVRNPKNTLEYVSLMDILCDVLPKGVELGTLKVEFDTVEVGDLEVIKSTQELASVDEEVLF